MNTVPAIEKPNLLREYLVAARHRRGTLTAAFAITMVIVILLAVLLPPRYRSAGTVLIEQQEMPQELVRSTVTSYADERVQVISKRVMTTETLLNIIRRYDLYPKERAKETREALLKRMRKDIALKMISADVIDPRSGRPTAATIAFEVSYTGASADQAVKVANELTTLYLNENLNNRTQLARDAAQFLESEADRVSHQIADLEAKLAQFKDQNQQKLPELTQLNMTLLDRTDQQLREEQARKDSLEQQLLYLQAQLAQLKPNSAVFSETGERIVSSADRLKMARTQLDSARAIYAPDHPDVQRLEREVAGLEKEVVNDPHVKAPDPSSLTNDLRRRLETARAALADASEKYGSDHPDRIRLQKQVDDLQAQLAAAPPPTATAQVTTPFGADNPAYVQIQAQIEATRTELAALATEMSKLRAQAADYQRNISMSPQVEKEYRELSRDYENARVKYAEVRSKQQEAKTAQDLEADRKGERFTLIDPPLPPEEPISPNRPLILGVGLVLSLGLTLGVLRLLEGTDTTIRSRRDLVNLTGIPPLALVPHIGTLGEFRAARRRMWLAAGTSAATVCIAVALIHFFYMPLDVLWFAVARRFGF